MGQRKVIHFCRTDSTTCYRRPGTQGHQETRRGRPDGTEDKMGAKTQRKERKIQGEMAQVTDYLPHTTHTHANCSRQSPAQPHSVVSVKLNQAILTTLTFLYIYSKILFFGSTYVDTSSEGYCVALAHSALKRNSNLVSRTTLQTFRAAHHTSKSSPRLGTELLLNSKQIHDVALMMMISISNDSKSAFHITSLTLVPCRLVCEHSTTASFSAYNLQKSAYR